MIPNDSTALYDFKHFAEHFYHESRRKGERNDTALAFVGGAMVLIGVQIVLKAVQGMGRGR